MNAVVQQVGRVKDVKFHVTEVNLVLVAPISVIVTWDIVKAVTMWLVSAFANMDGKVIWRSYFNNWWNTCLFTSNISHEKIKLCSGWCWQVLNWENQYSSLCTLSRTLLWTFLLNNHNEKDYWCASPPILKSGSISIFHLLLIWSLLAAVKIYLGWQQ